MLFYRIYEYEFLHFVQKGNAGICSDAAPSLNFQSLIHNVDLKDWLFIINITLQAEDHGSDAVVAAGNMYLIVSKHFSASG